MLDDRPYMRRSHYHGTWSMTVTLLVINLVCFILQNALRNVVDVGNYLALSVNGIRHGYVYQLVTFQFLHGGLLHLVSNLLMLYMFGRSVEESLGKRGMLQVYLLSGAVGGLLHVLLAVLFPLHFGGAVVGASAGVFGLVAAFATRSPDQPMGLFFLPIFFPAKVLLIVETAVAILGIVTPNNGIAHAAHLGGIITGFVYIRWLMHAPRPVWRPRRRSQPRELVSTTPVKKAPWKKPAQTLEELPPEEFISKEVDPILDKISAHGIQSLTDREKQILEAARKKMSKR